MNIGIISFAGCIRCIKECRMLAKAGHKLWFFSHFPPQAPKDLDLTEVFFHQSYYSSQQELYDKIKGLDFLDIIHVHNEPSWMVNVAKAAGHKKVVLDAHDLDIVRYGWKESMDKGGEDIKAIGECDGLIVPCSRYIEIIEDQAQLRIPTMTLFSYVNKDDFVNQDDYQDCDKLGGVVYQGSIYEPSPNHPLPYRIYDKVAKEIIDMGIDFHIYPGRGYEKHMYYYEQLGCKVHESLDPKELIKNLARHDWGFCGSPIEHRQWHNTIANKLFDYIAAGIPSFIYKADATKGLFGKKGIGVCIDNLLEIKDYYSGAVGGICKDTIKKEGKEYTMEGQLTMLEQFYKKVLNR